MRKGYRMSISFNGIKNCQVLKKEYSKEGMYVDDYGEIKRGKKNYQEVVLRAKLTDDKDGNHLSQYQKAMPKGFENAKGKDLVDIHIKRFVPEPDEDDILYPNLAYSEEANATNMIELNGKQFEINNDNKLPMASFLAHLTKRDLDLTGMSDNQKNVVGVINKSIDEKARDYLDM